MDKNKIALIGIGGGLLLLLLLLRKTGGGNGGGSGSVTGYVVGDGGLIAGAIITIDGKQAVSSAPYGHYRVDGLAAGEYILHAEYPGYIPRDYSVTIVVGEITWQDIALYKG